MTTLSFMVCLVVSATTAVEKNTSVESNALWVRGGAEIGMQSLPQTQDVSAVNSFLTLTPILGWGADGGITVELGVPLRLHLNEQTGNTPLRALGKLVRPEDWDELSDFGQLLRHFKIGEQGQAFHLQAGPFTRYTLGHGHLVNRYSNQENPNYHPAGVQGEWVIGPTRTQAFVSDVLGARLMAVDLSTDLGRLFGRSASVYDTYHLSLSAARDFGSAGGRTTSMSAAHVDFDAVVYRQRFVQVTLVAGAGARLYAPPTDFGAVAGAMIDAQWGQRTLGVKLEIRRQAGRFRQGLFGPNHELGRFSGLGFSQAPISDERLPVGMSGYAEFHWASGSLATATSDTRFWCSAASEIFASQRVDADVQVGVQSGRRFSGTLRAAAVGMGVASRYAVSLETRYRFLPSFYGVGSVGNVYFPQPDGSLARGVFAGLSAGFDFES